MAICLLFPVRPHFYELSRAHTLSANEAGFSGLTHLSFYSRTRTVDRRFETTYGLSLRRFPLRAEQSLLTTAKRNYRLLNSSPQSSHQIELRCQMSGGPDCCVSGSTELQIAHLRPDIGAGGQQSAVRAKLQTIGHPPSQQRVPTGESLRTAGALSLSRLHKAAVQLAGCNSHCWR